MRKFIALILSVLAVTFVLSGCGGGGGKKDGGPNSGQSIYSLHFQDQNKTAMAGVVINYTDPSGQPHNTTASNASGNSTVIFNQAGLYPIISVTLSNGKVIQTPADTKFDVPQSDIDNNINKSFVATIDITDPDNPVIGYDPVPDEDNKSIYSLHFQDQNKTAMAGVVINYTNPSGQPHSTTASNSKGDSTVIFDQAGSYPINRVSLSNGKFIQISGMEFDISQDDINDNVTKSFLVTIDTTDPNNPVIGYDKKATYNLHFQNSNTGAAMAGVVISYTVSGQSRNSDASNSSGDSTIVFDQAGVYPINRVTLSGGIAVEIPTGVNFEVPQDDIDNNVTKKFLIKINPTSNQLVSYDEIN